MAAIDDAYAESSLSDRHKLVVEVTDHVLAATPLPAEVRSRAEVEFGVDGLGELVLTVAVAHGFSKAAIAWGPPPNMPVTEIPTPS